MLNRKNAPSIHAVRNLILPQTRLVRLDNGIPVYILDFPDQGIVKIEAVFRAGRPEETKRITARATSRLMREGTRARTGAEIAEHFDFYGASLNTPSNLDTASFMLLSLKKYAHELIPDFAEILQEPLFPEVELDTFKRTNMQELQVELEKPEVVAYRKITECIFGEHHPYGYNSTPEDYLALTREDLLAYYDTWYVPSNCLLFAGGHIDDSVLDMLNRHFGQYKKNGQTPHYQTIETLSIPGKLHIPHPDSLQTAIKIGRRSFTRHHPDANGFFVLNTIFGGYFGSRLMMNIREKRGYTYNIYSTNDTYLHGGCFYISTEVTPDKVKQTLKEIFGEMKRLREKSVEESELDMVRNYLLGMLLNGLDGPLNTSDLVKGLIVEDLTPEAYQEMVDTIRNITPAQIQELAGRYFQVEDFWTITVGV